MFPFFSFLFFFSSTKLESKRIEQILTSGGFWHWWEVVGEESRRVNEVQIMCTHISKCKNETCRNYSRKVGEGDVGEEWRG
jgi:hypothetical protein